MECPTGECIGYGEYCSYEGPGGPGSGGGGDLGDDPPPSGGGGGSGGGGTPPDPCGGASGGRGIGVEGNLPCIEDPGWEPEPPIPLEDYNPLDADTVIIDADIRNNFPCVEKILDSINKFYVVVGGVSKYLNINSVPQLALHEVFNVNKKIHTTISVDWALTKDSADGVTNSFQPVPTNGEDFYTTIKLNPWVLQNATQEYIGAVILHEAYHAYIDYKYFEYYHGVIDSNQYKLLFPLYWPPRVGTYILQGSALQQHQQWLQI